MQAQPRHKASSIWRTSISQLITGRKSIPIAELAIFCRKLSFLLEAGLTIKAALLVLQDQKLGPTLELHVPQLQLAILQGASFTSALQAQGVFPLFMTGYIAMGEQTAQLTTVCSKLANMYEHQATLRRQLFAALVYPVAVLLMMLGVAIMAMLVVLPGYARIFDASGIALPAITRGLLRFSTFFSDNILSIGIASTIIFVGATYILRRRSVRYFLSKLCTKIPVFRQGLNFDIAQALSLLLSSGIQITNAVDLCAGLVQNPYAAVKLRGISIDLATGKKFSHALSQIHFIDPLMHELAQVGEETGSLPNTIEKCSTYFSATYTHSIIRLNKLVEPIITLVMGVLLMVIMLAVVLPTFELATML